MFRVYFCMFYALLALLGFAAAGVAAGLMLPTLKGFLALAGAGCCLLLLWDAAREFERAEWLLGS